MKKQRWRAWDSNPGGRMVGADESTELWRHPKFTTLFLIKKFQFCGRYSQNLRSPGRHEPEPVVASVRDPGQDSVQVSSAFSIWIEPLKISWFVRNVTVQLQFRSAWQLATDKYSFKLKIFMRFIFLKRAFPGHLFFIFVFSPNI